MLPEQPISFPEFVADQLLTADNLNDLFHYLDVQERGTRVNLIGIGIVCGLEVSVNEEGTEIKISKGCGITSAGYLVRWEEATFQNYKSYDAAIDLPYPLFNGTDDKKLALDELKRDASEDGITALSAEYLKDKLVLLHVELLRLNAKNCDPESCDDKGGNIKLTIRPLLINQKDAIKLSANANGEAGFQQPWVKLPQLKMPRHHLPAGAILSGGDVLEGFLQVMTADFISNLSAKLSLTYQQLLPLVKGSFPSNPFSGLAQDFAFIKNESFSATQLLYIQYYYDFFSDLIAAYDELRQLGMELLSLCCPDENSFPRHLLLGPASGSFSEELTIPSRQYFIPSPAVSCHSDMTAKLRFLFTRLVLMRERFLMPGAETAFLGVAGKLQKSGVKNSIRVTPSSLGAMPLSEKAIPFYYNVAAGSKPLYQYWNFRKSRSGTAVQILSYHAGQYSSGPDNKPEDEVVNPLKYDLEPYNFLRIEGHVGRRYTEALASISKIRDESRLPFDVVALNADAAVLRQQLSMIAKSTSRASLLSNVEERERMNCHFQDLEALYDTMAQGLICQLCKEMKFYYGLEDDQLRVNLLKPEVPLLKKCDPDYQYREGSYGELFEAFYKTLPAAYIAPDQFLGGFMANRIFSVNATTGNNNAGMFLVYALLYYIEKLSEIIPTSLTGFSIAAFVNRYDDLMTVAEYVKRYLRTESAQSDNGAASALLLEDVNDHVDALLYACNSARFIALYNEYKLRWIYLSMLQKFGNYVLEHPGFQHKAGVTMGGTFILVYHERERKVRDSNSIFSRKKTAAAMPQDQADHTVMELITEASPKKKLVGEAEKSAPPATEQLEDVIVRNAGAFEKMTASKSNIREIPLSKLKSLLSAKQRGLMDKLYYKDALTKRAVNDLLEELQDKVVIADFYLPYLCCSDCPPVYYVINEPKEEPDEAPPTISVEKDEFCQKDETGYFISVKPLGGEVKGDGVSKDPETGNFTFRPNEVSMGTEGFRDIVLTYTLNDQEATTSVMVYQQPSADFSVQGVVTHVDPNSLTFTAENSFDVTYEWDFGDLQQATGNPAAHRYAEAGNYSVQLTATNGPCVNQSKKGITIKSETPRVTCGPLEDILSLFKGLGSLDSKQFKKFKDKIYDPYQEVENYFTKLADQIGLSTADQIAFFQGSEIAGLLNGWLAALDPLVRDSDVRQIALALYRILMQLAMYVQCIQDGDIGKGAIDLSDVFRMIKNHLSGWFGFVGKFSPLEKAQLQLILDDINAEKARIKANGKGEEKKNYIEMLESLEAILEKYLK